MDRINTGQAAHLTAIVRREVDAYAGNMPNGKNIAIHDDATQTFAVVTLMNERQGQPTYVAQMARVLGNWVIIEQDVSAEKFLYEALMVNGGIPRDQIILAYQGEAIPEAA
jgi:hypothetical protein